eukprot:TRINITY_DN31897_c0_g1_i1.p1 TRINITY_DN31897_c0_g1~~TRINITY_DN31897_c0_g1_i1.p1  ORF type:complete len:217 (-),score=2.57 TRINITY_DN31897_c0_g1_i1:258-908(-)
MMASIQSSTRRSSELLSILLLVSPVLLLASASDITVSDAGTSRSPSFSRRQLFVGRYLCAKSTLAGYTSSRVMTPGMTLHWKATKGDTLEVAVVASKSSVGKGWFGFGWSAMGDMGGSNTVVRQGSTVSAYDLIEQSGFKAATTWEAHSPSVTDDGKNIIMKFSRKVGSGSITVKNKGLGFVVYAYGSTPTVAKHKKAEDHLVDFSCGCGIFTRKC